MVSSFVLSNKGIRGLGFKVFRVSGIKGKKGIRGLGFTV